MSLLWGQEEVAVDGGQWGPITHKKQHPEAIPYFGNPTLDCTAVALNSAPGTCGHDQEF